jgi:hypothetical protein
LTLSDSRSFGRVYIIPLIKTHFLPLLFICVVIIVLFLHRMRHQLSAHELLLFFPATLLDLSPVVRAEYLLIGGIGLVVLATAGGGLEVALVTAGVSGRAFLIDGKNTSLLSA